jgi:hypothetical protein
VTSWSEQALVAASAVLERAPDLDSGASRVRLEGLRYRMHLDLQEEGVVQPRRLTGEVILDALAGSSLPPFQVRGAAGWVSGYTAPVLSGTLGGALEIDGERVSFEGGHGYHDHNWGFWKDVTWRWGQVSHEDLSLLYGRILPPPEAADASRLPGLLVALGPHGPLGFATRVRIEEDGHDPADGRPRRIRVQARGAALDLSLDLDVEGVVRTTIDAGTEFLQLRASYRVRGEIAGREVDFTALGSAETFRGGLPVQSRRESVSSR